ncbi:MAG: SOUL family heme-binding protein [Aeromicrobium sp.]
MTEQQAYDVVAQYPGFELRRYPTHTVAEMVIDGSFQSAGNKAFRPLSGYIGGRNRSGSKVAMTAPVVQESIAAQSDAMVAPVVHSEAGSGQYVVSFVMPAGFTEKNLPEPEDPRVKVRTVPAELAAALRYSGRWSQGSYEDKAEQLLEAVEAAGLQITGPLRFARFDPPWTPWFRRRNEVVAPVAEA